MKFLLSFCFLMQLCFQVLAQKANDTFSVFFELDVDVLGETARTSIDSLFYVEKIRAGIPVSIIGYADYLNTDAYNKGLSERRAEHVKAYLVASGLRESDIRLLLGKGEVKRGDTVHAYRGIPRDRRVDIVMEYAKPPVSPTRSRDTVIVMHPSEKKIVPPYSTDPGFDITKIPKGKTFILNNIYFPMGRHFPKQDSYEEIDKLLAALRDFPGLVIQIEGHVCCITNVQDALDLDSHELDLSVNRARFIFEYLKARDIPESRLRYVGFGKSRPIYQDEQTEREAAANRRVEIRILDW